MRRYGSIKLVLPRQKSDLSCICVYCVSNLPLSSIFVLDFENVPTYMVFFVFNLRESSFIVFYFDESGIYYQKQILCFILMTFLEIFNLQWIFYSKLLKNQELYCFKCCRNVKCCHSQNFWNLLLVLYLQSMMSSNRYKEKQKNTTLSLQLENPIEIVANSIPLTFTWLFTSGKLDTPDIYMTVH